MHFHFLRPGWFLILLPMVFLLWYFWQQKEKRSVWEAVCDPVLLPYLLEKRHVMGTRFTLICLSLAWLFAAIALSGPTWSTLPEQVYQSSRATVMVLDVSPEMAKTDLMPSRFVRAKYKLLDLLKNSTEGSMGLVVFSGEAYTVAPLTRDTQTLINLASTLEPSLMPVSGANLAQGLTLAAALLEQGQGVPASIIVLLGSTPNAEATKVAKALESKNIQINVLEMSPHLTENPLGIRQGQSVRFTESDADIKTVLAERVSESAKRLSEEKALKWKDEGRWFLLPWLFCVLLAFCRGALDL
jgi:Ca-activated chloride channel family protein